MIDIDIYLQIANVQYLLWGWGRQEEHKQHDALARRGKMGRIRREGCWLGVRRGYAQK